MPFVAYCSAPRGVVLCGRGMRMSGKNFFGDEGDDEWSVLGWRPPLWLHVAIGVFVGTMASSFVLTYVWSGLLQQAMRGAFVR